MSRGIWGGLDKLERRAKGRSMLRPYVGEGE